MFYEIFCKIIVNFLKNNRVRFPSTDSVPYTLYSLPPRELPRVLAVRYCAECRAQGRHVKPPCGPDYEPDMRYSATFVCGRDRSVGIGYSLKHMI